MIYIEFISIAELTTELLFAILLAFAETIESILIMFMLILFMFVLMFDVFVPMVIAFD